MKLVLDASVVVKWLIPDDPTELDTDRAGWVLRALDQGDLEAVQPIHWLIEVASVLVRIRPSVAQLAARYLDAMNLPVRSDPEVLTRGIALSTELGHHLFDTLYHAVALETGSTLLTADRRYFRKARPIGSIQLLDTFAGAFREG